MKETWAINDLQNAVNVRRSRRKYLPTPLDGAAAEHLQALIEELNNKENIKMRLVLDNGDAFNGLRKSYGMFSGVRNYVALIGNKDDRIGLEKLGYFGEQMVLCATALGLGTCWVGGTFDRSSCSVELAAGEYLVCTITVGNVPSAASTKEKFLHNLIHRKSKTIEEMVCYEGPLPSWFMDGMKAVQKAPSAAHRQPVRFTYKDDVVTAAVEDIASEYVAIDLGIAKLHFALGAGDGKWAFGNGAEYSRGV